MYGSKAADLLDDKDQSALFAVQAHRDFADAMRALMSELKTQLKLRGRYSGSKLALMQFYGAALCALAPDALCVNLTPLKRLPNMCTSQSQPAADEARVSRQRKMLKYQLLEPSPLQNN